MKTAEKEKGPEYISPSTPIDQRPVIRDKADLKKMYPEWFDPNDKYWKDYQYGIKIDPRRIPLELKSKFKAKLDGKRSTSSPVAHRQSRLIRVQRFVWTPFVRLLKGTSAWMVVRAMKSIFSENGTPEKVVSDNGTHFTENLFRKFAMKWDFQLIISSPQYPLWLCQGNANFSIYTNRRFALHSLYLSRTRCPRKKCSKDSNRNRQNQPITRT